MSTPTNQPDPLQQFTETEQELWQALISIVISLPVVLDRELRRKDGMTHFEFSVLARLSQAPDNRLKLRDLAQQTGSTLPRLSKAMTRCERDGWTVRMPDAADGRSTWALLTDGGKEHLLSSAPAHLAQVRRLVLDPLTISAQRHLRTSLPRVADAVGRELTNQAPDEPI